MQKSYAFALAEQFDVNIGKKLPLFIGLALPLFNVFGALSLHGVNDSSFQLVFHPV